MAPCLSSLMTQADRPNCKESCVVLRHPVNIRYFCKKNRWLFLQ